MSKMPVICLLLLPVLSWSQDFTTAVDFSIDLSTLDNASAARMAAADGRIVLLEGVVGEVESGMSNEIFELRIILVNGFWIGTTDIRTYSCLIRFTGDEWQDLFPMAGEDDPIERQIMEGSRLLIAARVSGYNEAAAMATAEGEAIRILR